jgi:hypothetical protein
MKSKKVVYRYDNEDDKAKVSSLPPYTASCSVAFLAATSATRQVAPVRLA